MLFTLMSCQDIINTEPKYQKELLRLALTPEDSLQNLTITPVDLGTVKMMSSTTAFISLKNISNSAGVIIYSAIGKNTSGLFVYDYPQGLPFDIQPFEDSQTTQKLRIKFIANTFTTGFYYDTLLLNNTTVGVPVKVNVIF